ncbi:MAG: VOC family protein [Acidimicrobiia bacterium]
MRAYVVVPQRRSVCEVVFDCHDVRRLAEFWAAVLSGPSDTTPERVSAQVRSDDWAMVVDTEGVAVALAFQRVPEGKSVKNRVHLDITSDDLTLDTARLVALGATTIGSVVTDESGAFQVLADPEGNEFCLVD